jgi:hypothetical protein
MKLDIFRFLLLTAIAAVIFASVASGQTAVLKPDVPVKFTLEGKKAHEYMMDLKAEEVCNISTDAPEELLTMMAVNSPNGEALIKDVEASEGYIFIAQTSGTYRVIFSPSRGLTDEDIAKQNGKRITVTYSNKFSLPNGAETAAVRNVNGYQVKIANEAGDEGKTYLLIQKAGRLKALMRAEKNITGGYYFSDDPSQEEGYNAKHSTELMRTTADKTGDGEPDIAVEYYTGGAHCCFEITFFELGANVRQLPTIDTDNVRLSAVARRPEGGLRFRSNEQAFAYWNINFAQSPMPVIIYEFDKTDRFVPRFGLMKKPAPTLAKLKRDAAAAKSKINLNPYISPEDNFNDWAEPFWGYMLDLIYTGHEDLAWQYFDLVWPARKKGKEKFRADFKEQLAMTAYGVSKDTGLQSPD